MKKYIFFIALIAGGYFFLQKYGMEQNTPSQINEPKTANPCQDTTPLRVVFFQDGSGSIINNGVAIVSSTAFAGYYNNTSRYIELNVGVITDRTAKKLITLNLLPARFVKPAPVEYKNVTIADRKKVSTAYQTRLRKYEADSLGFFADRVMRINEFRGLVDTMFNKYRIKQSRSTDLAPVVDIADKVFNFSLVDGSTNYFIINTDGLDSKHRKAKPMKNKATVIMVNANGIMHTDIDSIITTTLQSTEQAIKYSLTKQSKI